MTGLIHGGEIIITNSRRILASVNSCNNNYNPDIVVAIDACLGKLDEVGKITLSNSPLTPGAALNKELPAVGDISIMGIVNMGGFLELQVLQCTRLHTVMKLASDITHLIWQAVPASRKETQLLNKQSQCS